GGGRLVGGRVMPLPPGPGMIAVILEHLGDGGTAFRDRARVSIPVIRQLGDLAAGDAMLIAPGEQRRARGRTHRGGVKPVVGNSLLRDFAHRWCMNLTAESVRLRRSDVV